MDVVVMVVVVLIIVAITYGRGKMNECRPECNTFFLERVITSDICTVVRRVLEVI